MRTGDVGTVLLRRWQCVQSGFSLAGASSGPEAYRAYAEPSEASRIPAMFPHWPVHVLTHYRRRTSRRCGRDMLTYTCERLRLKPDGLAPEVQLAKQDDRQHGAAEEHDIDNH